MLDMKPSLIIFIICTSLIVVAVILCCFCMIRGGEKKETTQPTTPSVSIGRSRPLWPPQTYHDVEFGEGFRTYKQDSRRSEQSILTDRQGTQRSEQSVRTDRYDTERSGIKDGGVAILAGAGAALATAAAVLGFSSERGEGGGYGDDSRDGVGGDGDHVDGGSIRGGGCGNGSQL